MASLTDLSSILPSTSNTGISTDNGGIDSILNAGSGGSSGLSSLLGNTNIGSALSGAGLLSSGLSGNPTTPASSTSGFAALPAAVQNAWLQTYLPAAVAQTSKAYQAPPLQRAATSPGMFQSQGLADLQKYSDQVGGLFGKTGSSPVAPNYGSTLAGATNATTNPGLATADSQATALHGMNLSQYVNTMRPDVAKALGYQPGSVNVNDPNVIQWWNQYGSKGS